MYQIKDSVTYDDVVVQSTRSTVEQTSGERSSSSSSGYMENSLKSSERMCHFHNEQNFAKFSRYI